jgi:uncharacterized oxidoreductase
MKTSGNTVLITGGATGIGFALAEILLENDNEVVVCGRRREMLAKARAKHPEIHTKVCDVSRPRSRVALLEWLNERFTSLNILVNNAGIQRVVDLTKGPRDMEDAEAEIAINFEAPMELSALLIPYLKRKRSSAIVNITSGLAFAPLASIPVYCATKAALHSLSLSMRHQLKGTSIRVFEIAPPGVDTELSGPRRRREVPPWMMSAEDAARGILDALKGDVYEAALGQAEGLRRDRETVFERMNQ